MDTKKIEELTQRLLKALPPGLLDIKKDLEKNFRSILQSTFVKMDLVTREEFDAQVAVLKRTREKVDQLEKKLTDTKSPRKK